MTPHYNRYSPSAWLIACDISAKRSRRRRARVARRYKITTALMGLGTIGLGVLLWLVV